MTDIEEIKEESDEGSFRSEDFETNSDKAPKKVDMTKAKSEGLANTGSEAMKPPMINL